MNTRRYSIVNIWVDALGIEQALQEIKAWIESGERVYTVFAANPEKNFSVPKDPLLYEMFAKADLLIPDGIGMVLAARILHKAEISRVPGCELMERICALAAANGYPIYVYGAKETVNAQATETLTAKYPGLHIAGRSNGYVKEEDMETLVKDINASGAQILFLALGSPKQEQWIAAHADKLNTVRVCQGIGGTLDVITGKVKRAPEFFCKTGLEWFYRLLAEPKRWKRQMVLPLFAWRVVVQRLKRQK